MMMSQKIIMIMISTTKADISMGIIAMFSKAIAESNKDSSVYVGRCYESGEYWHYLGYKYVKTTRHAMRTTDKAYFIKLGLEPVKIK